MKKLTESWGTSPDAEKKAKIERKIAQLDLGGQRAALDAKHSIELAKENLDAYVKKSLQVTEPDFVAICLLNEKVKEAQEAEEIIKEVQKGLFG